ncbi:MAG: hypothetical protein GYB64_02935 [Chloroflexi bacterium]|nr:hypothetical protein [Chloroflexota bacterium]
MLHIAHIQTSSFFGLLLCLYLLHRLLDEPSWRWATGLGAMFAFTLATSGYLAYCFVIAGGLITTYAVLRLRVDIDPAQVQISASVELTPPPGTVPGEFPIEPAPAVFTWLAEQPGDEPVLHLPLHKTAIVAILQFQAMHDHPMINGVGSFVPDCT